MKILSADPFQEEKFKNSVKHGGVLLLLAVLVFMAYSSSLNASWHLDDYHAIVDNPRLHVNDLQPESLLQTFYASPSGGDYQSNKIYRPLPNLSFALNWFVHRDKVMGYHIVNMAVHMATAFFLYLTCLVLLDTPNMRGRYEGMHFIIALTATCLWALNPIQTQAISYIVQRMAAMAAMFYTLGLFFYLRGRLTNDTKQRFMLFCWCLVSYMCALGSKQNAALLPISLLLVEIVFFSDGDYLKRAKGILIAGGVIAGVALAGICLFMKGDPLYFLRGYSERSFTLLERLLTEPRVLVLHLSQIFYPLPERFSIEHDIPVSTSLLEPWTTLPAILICLFLMAFGYWQLRKYPLLGFSILFFFLNHIIESTVFALELVFEHRNYLPSLFLFLPLTAGLIKLLNVYRHQHRVAYGVLASLAGMLVLGFGSATYVRNMAWSTEQTLWQAAADKAPNQARPLINLAWGHYQKKGHYQEALKLYGQSLKLESQKPVYTKAATLSNMGGIYFLIEHYDKAIDSYREALQLFPKHEKSRYWMAMALAAKGELNEAEKNLRILLTKRDDHKDYLNLTGFILLKKGRPQQAIPFFRVAMSLAPNDRVVLFNLGVSLSRLGGYTNADWFLRRAHQMHPADALPIFCLLENSIRAKKGGKIRHYVQVLLNRYSPHQIHEMLGQIEKGHLFVPVATNLIAPHIPPAVTKSNWVGQRADISRPSL